MEKGVVSSSVVKRLPRYYRFLDELEKQGIDKISSRELSERMRVTASQIRQDLNCFGDFGQQGYGYNIPILLREIGEILGVEKAFKTIIIGAGNLGKTIATHMDFESKGCELIGIFDVSENIVGTTVGSLEVLDENRLEEFCKEYCPKIAVLCIPKEVAKSVVEKLINFGITAFWNYSHYDLEMEFDKIIVENVHLGDSLLTLSYRVNNNDARKIKTKVAKKPKNPTAKKAKRKVTQKAKLKSNNE